MEWPNWVGKDREVVEIKVPTNAILLVLNPDLKNQPSRASIVYFNDIREIISNLEGFNAWIQSSGICNQSAGLLPKVKNNFDSLTFRVFGNLTQSGDLIKALEAVGIRKGSLVSLSSVLPSVFHFLPNEQRIRILKEVLGGSDEKNAPRIQEKIKVLVVDDSETIRKILSYLINSDKEMECVAALDNPLLAFKAIERHRPDVITLDIHMPEMDGVTLLKKIQEKYSIPTIMISSLSKDEGTFVLDALEAGAVDYIQKPAFSEIESVKDLICEKIKSAKQAKVQTIGPINSVAMKEKISNIKIDPSFLIAIGSSTGGTEALRKVFLGFPRHIPPVLVVQHIPPVFSKEFADRMNKLLPFTVKEAQDGDEVKEDTVFIAPGGMQMGVIESRHRLVIKIEDAPPVNRHKPSVDYLFNTIASLNLSRITAAILTGMGGDGAKGLLKLKQKGAKTFAEDESTCVVFGMPKEALKLGAANKAVPIQEMAFEILSACQKRN